MAGAKQPNPGSIALLAALVGCGGPDRGDDPFATSAPTGQELSTGVGSSADGSDEAGSTGGDGSGTDAGSAESGSGGQLPEHMPPGLCDEPRPNGAPSPPVPPSYSGGVCPGLDSGYVTGFLSGGRQRELAFVVPEDYDASKSYPLVFLWYHLSGDAKELVDTLGVQDLANYTQAIMVVPQATGDFEFVWPSTPLDVGQSSVDLGFFDDLLACIVEQYNINRDCVSSVGVSAGGLWTAYLGQHRGQYLASNLTFSGGRPPDALWWPWQASPHTFAALVLWGGPSDELILNFHQASIDYLARLRNDGHFALRCEHTGGHGLPPIEPGDTSPFEAVFHFVRNHPFWLAGDSPLSPALPELYPEYCQLP